MKRTTLPRSFPDHILADLRMLELRHLQHLPTTGTRTPERLLQDLLKHGGGRFFIAHQRRRKLIPMGILLKELDKATAMPAKDSVWGERRIFWNHGDLDFLLLMAPGGWVVCDDYGDPIKAKATSERPQPSEEAQPLLLERRLAA